MERGRRTYFKNGHSIELCDVALAPEGGQVDIPLRDLAPITVEVLRRGLLSDVEVELIMETAAESLRTQRIGSH
jgi:hypothetical protein